MTLFTMNTENVTFEVCFEKFCVVREDQDIATLGIVFDALAKIRNEPFLNDMFIADHIY